MREIISGVYLIEGLRGCNAYLLVTAEGLMLVDSGMPWAAGKIVAQMEEAGYAVSDLQAIVVTHAHDDHTGGVAGLVERSGAQVLAHRDEVAYVEGRESLPVASFVQQVMKWLGERSSSRRWIRVDRSLEDGEVIEGLGGLRVIHVPGHTPGSLCLYGEESRILFCGDVLFHKRSARARGGLQYALPMASVDKVQARESAQRLRGLEIEVLCLGHGKPILEGAGERIEALLRAG